MYASIRTAAAAVAFLLLAPTAGAQPADTEKILKELGFPADTLAQVRAGKMVETELESSEEREIAAGLAFLVKEAPEALAKELREGLLISIDANSQAHGALSGDGTSGRARGVEARGPRRRLPQREAGRGPEPLIGRDPGAPRPEGRGRLPPSRRR